MAVAARKVGGVERTDMKQARIEAMLEDFDVEVNSRCESLRSTAKELAFSIESLFKIEQLRLPSNIRSMPMREFCSSYGGDPARAIGKFPARPALQLCIDGIEVKLTSVDALKSMDTHQKAAALEQLRKLQQMSEEILQGLEG